MASPETLNIDAINATWAGASGAATDIDEAVADADATYYGGGPENDAADFGFANTGEIIDGDTTTDITFNMILRDDGSAGTTEAAVELIIDGSPVGGAVTLDTSGSDAEYSFNTGAWNVDFTQAQINGLQMRVTPTQSGMPGTNALFIDCADCVITFTKNFTPDVDAWRFYDDDGGEAASTALEAQDTDENLDVSSGDVAFQLRVRVQETGGVSGASTDDYRIQVDKNTTGYVSISTGSSDVKASNSGLTNNAATTNRATEGIADGTGSFVAGEQSTDGVLEDNQITADDFTEYVYGLTVVAADLSDSDTLDFRILGIGPTVINSVTPRITITKDGAAGSPKYYQDNIISPYGVN